MFDGCKCDFTRRLCTKKKMKCSLCASLSIFQSIFLEPLPGDQSSSVEPKSMWSHQILVCTATPSCVAIFQLSPLYTPACPVCRSPMTIFPLGMSHSGSMWNVWMKSCAFSLCSGKEWSFLVLLGWRYESHIHPIDLLRRKFVLWQGDTENREELGQAP